MPPHHLAPDVDERMNVKWLSVFTSVAIAGCSSEAKAPPRAASAPLAEVAPAPPPAPAPVVKPAAALEVSKDIQSACALPGSQATFGYNSAKVRAQDQLFLKQLTQCLTRGPLAQKKLRLVGHADPRGSSAYNFALGRERADSIKTALVTLGLPGPQAQTESRGKLDATGTDESGWARDRRVVASLLE